jgi:folate-binding protein YgfZ
MLESMATIDASSAQQREPAERYGAIDDQYRTLTEGCGLLDRSERGRLALSGQDAAEFLNGQVTNDVARLTPGEGCYAAFLTHKGKMLGDLRILLTEEELLLDTERVALQALFDMIRRFSIGYRVELHKRTLQTALLSLIGPRSEEVLERGHSGTGALGLAAGEHSHALGRLAGMSARAIRTDVGVDVLCDAEGADRVREALLAAGARTVSEQAAEIIRVERGRPRYGVDLDDTTIPQEAGLNERAVSFTKGCYVGQETVARLYYRGKPNRLLRGVRLSEPVHTGAPLRLGEREVGRLTSPVLSPRLGAIGLALVRVGAGPGSTLAAGEGGARGIVTELPFPAR